MKIAEVIAFVDDIKPNAFSDETKLRWINECEAMIQTEVLLISPHDIVTYKNTDTEFVLLIDIPYDKIYTAYLCAMVDFSNGEYAKYQNSMALYNSLMGDLRRFIAGRFRPADREEE